jgi:hypothetical protein
MLAANGGSARGRLAKFHQAFGGLDYTVWAAAVSEQPSDTANAVVSEMHSM